MAYACRVERLGKRYRVERAAPRGNFGYRTLQEELIRLSTAPWRRLRNRPSACRVEDFWALTDVDLEVQPGEVVGIIGRNGAGKSTLLKILSRITKPTTGEVELWGRVASLLEVGTGFHPELTGRENIYLNGAILGMSRREIDRKFDAIVAFAEVEQFLNTPVKRYSSGMYVRLAFAVAAYLEPEILIVDEVLAVGDMAFQRKCLGRMRDVGQSGRTVLFVSHSMPAIESLCTRGILLDGGRIVYDGAVTDLIGEYRRRVLAPLNGQGPSQFDREDPSRTNPIFHSATLLDESGNPVNFLPVGGAFHLRIGLQIPDVIDHPRMGIGIDDTLGHRLLTCYTPLSTVAIEQLAGQCEVDCLIEEFPLAPGDYWLKLGMAVKGVPLDALERALFFSVADGDLFGEGRGFDLGLCVCRTQWNVVATSTSSAGEPRN
jgi:lipopolysaccharide transport system ATP-binding protein